MKRIALKVMRDFVNVISRDILELIHISKKELKRV